MVKHTQTLPNPCEYDNINLQFFAQIIENFAKFWRARSRLCRNRFLQVNNIILQEFSISTRLAHFCTGPDSKNSKTSHFQNHLFSWNVSKLRFKNISKLLKFNFGSSTRSSCRSEKMLQNTCLLSKIYANTLLNTAENERNLPDCWQMLDKIFQNWSKFT